MQSPLNSIFTKKLPENFSKIRVSSLNRHLHFKTPNSGEISANVTSQRDDLKPLRQMLAPPLKGRLKWDKQTERFLEIWTVKLLNDNYEAWSLRPWSVFTQSFSNSCCFECWSSELKFLPPPSPPPAWLSRTSSPWTRSSFFSPPKSIDLIYCRLMQDEGTLVKTLCRPTQRRHKATWRVGKKWRRAKDSSRWSKQARSETSRVEKGTAC